MLPGTSDLCVAYSMLSITSTMLPITSTMLPITSTIYGGAYSHPLCYTRYYIQPPNSVLQHVVLHTQLTCYSMLFITHSICNNMLHITSTLCVTACYILDPSSMLQHVTQYTHPELHHVTHYIVLHNVVRVACCP